MNCPSISWAVADVLTGFITNTGEATTPCWAWSTTSRCVKVKPRTGRTICTWPRKNSMSATSGSGNRVGVVVEPRAVAEPGQGDEAALQVADVRLGQVLVL